MKSSLVWLLLLSALLCSCGKDELPCETLVESIQSDINNEIVNFTQIEIDGMVTSELGLPSFNGCLMTFDGVVYNLDYLFNYEVRQRKLILRFN